MFWTVDTGIDGQTPVDLDELDLVGINPLLSWILRPAPPGRDRLVVISL